MGIRGIGFHGVGDDAAIWMSSQVIERFFLRPLLQPLHNNF
jgi:hypothetical protein